MGLRLNKFNCFKILNSFSDQTSADNNFSCSKTSLALVMTTFS